jgi:hypothetical protein
VISFVQFLGSVEANFQIFHYLLLHKELQIFFSPEIQDEMQIIYGNIVRVRVVI